MEVLAARDLTFGYEDCPVLDRFSCSIEGGAIVRLDGVNGSGKTTLLNCFTTIVNSGRQVFYKGVEVATARELVRNLSYVMSEDTLYDYMTVRENVGFFDALFGGSASFANHVQAVLAQLSCDTFGDVLVKNLSQGTRSKVYLAIMLAKEADVLLLDEPFTALDKQSQGILIDHTRRLNREQGLTVVFVSHVDEFKQLADCVIQVPKIGGGS
jgi:ABC-type multidrug transport system ATPase subunit